jgi:P4 family phage/plasmid primase-like protien
MSKIESGKLTVTNSVFSLSELINDVSNIINYRNGVFIYDHNTERFFRTCYEKTAVEYIKLDEKEEVYTGSNVKYRGQTLKMPIGYAVEHDKTIYNYDQLDDVLKQLGINYIPTSQIPCDYHKRDLCTTADVDAFCNASEVYDDCKCPIFLGFLNQLAGMPVMPKDTTDDDMMQAALARCIPMTQGGAAGINTYADAVQLKRLLLLWYGLTLSGVPGYATKRLLMLIGAGNTGKSQYIRLLESLIHPDNAAEVSLHALSNSRFALADAMDKRMIYDADARALKVQDISTIKNITGGDRISYERKCKDPVTTIYKGTVIIAANQLPVFGGDTGDHVYDRFIVVPCNNVVSPDKRDPYIVDKMLEEATAITQLAIAALREQMAIGLNKIKLPACCITAVNEYKETNDPTVTFLLHCTERRAGEPDVGKDKEYGAKVYAAYKDWAQREGHYVVSLSQFKQAAKNVYGNKITCNTRAAHGGYSYYTFKLTEGYKQTMREQALQDQRESLRRSGY